MSTFDLTSEIFHDDDAARAHLEAQRWPNGPECPHCGEHHANNITRLDGLAHRPGLYQCNSCRKQFSVTVGTVFADSKIGLAKWVLATHLMSASKKGVSAKQIQRMLGITYKSAWFMCHRIRLAMTPADDTPEAGPIGGKGKTIEADETFVGGKKKNVHRGKPEPKKQPVVALVKRQMYGTHHAVSEQHLQRYINEIAFRWNNREKLGIDDAARANNALKGIAGKRLTYRRTDEA